MRIHAAELNWVEITDNGRRLCLRMRDPAGHAVSVSLPVECVNKVLTAVPRTTNELLAGGVEQVYAVDSWSLGQDLHGLVLTLHLPDGARIAFAVKPWQISAMASLVGLDMSPGRDRLN